MLIKKFIIAGLILSIGLVMLNAHLVFGSDFQMLLFGVPLPFNQRSFVLLIGVGLIALRWFLVHRKRADNDES